MAILFISSFDRVDDWRAAMKAALPEAEFRAWPDEIGDPAEIDYILTWKPKPGALIGYPNLKAIFSLGAGVDHLVLAEGPLPKVPIVRLVDVALTRDMVQYVVHWVLHFHRDMHLYREHQLASEWKRHSYPEASQRRIGFLGSGVLGGACAKALAGFEFDVATWTRGPKKIEGVTSFHGADGLEPFLARSEILVCLLPLTTETRGILNKQNLAALPKGAYVINAARGAHVVEHDLIAALDSGQIAAAALDVFPQEPLAAAHPFWKHPKIRVTPHVASFTTARTAALEIAANIRRIQSGQPPTNVIDADLKY
jgi:glyoxylate/hydroxypyruvate reductase A